MAVAIDPLREGRPMEGMWLSDLVKGWSPALRAFFVGLARNGLSAHPEEVPLSGFIAFLRFYTLLRRDTWAFSYLPANGDTILVKPLVGKLRKMGGTVITPDSRGVSTAQWSRRSTRASPARRHFRRAETHSAQTASRRTGTSWRPSRFHSCAASLM